MAMIPDSCNQRMPTMDAETEEGKLRALKATLRDPSYKTRIVFKSDIYWGKYNSLGQHYSSLKTLPSQHLSCYQEDRRKQETKRFYTYVLP